MPGRWADQPVWHALALDTPLSLLQLWQDWRQTAQVTDRLFCTAVLPEAPSASALAQLAQSLTLPEDLARALAQAWQGLMPGVHRLTLEGGRVQWTLCIGPARALLRELDTPVHSITLTHWPDDEAHGLHTLKALARLCQTGTTLRIASAEDRQDALRQCGFEALAQEQAHADKSVLQAVYAPRWTPRSKLRQPSGLPRQALVLGAGLSGSATAYSLAQRGWHVTVLDAGAAPGAGASGLPAGLTAPHVSPDDHVLSRITRAGVRATVQRAAALLHSGQDWGPSGVLEHRVEGKRSLPTGDAWPDAGHAWSTPASAAQIAKAGLPPEAQALWHGLAAWVRPRPLVAAQLAHPRIQVRWQSRVERLAQQDGHWNALDAQGHALAQAPVLVIAGGYDTRALLQAMATGPAPLPLNPLRGQISMGPLSSLPSDTLAQLPPFPVNGHGSFITGVPLPDGSGPGWYLGSTFERACPEALLREGDHAANHARLATLLPGLSEPLREAFAPAQVQGWAGLRCTLPDRLPAVGALDAERWPGLHICAGMGARGISLSVLAGELIAAQLEGEPLPLAPSLATYLAAQRFGAR